MNSSKSDNKIKSFISGTNLPCDSCEFVAHCDLKGPSDSTCPHHFDYDQNDKNPQELQFTDRTYKTIRFIEVISKEQEISFKLTTGDFRILEYAAYQLEVSLESYIRTMIQLEIREIKRKYDLKLF